LQLTRLLLVFMLSLSLSAQAFAGALLPCKTNSPEQNHGEMKMLMSAMDHSQMSTHSMESIDCCIQECKCPKAACTSIALLNTATFSLEVPPTPRLVPPAVELPNVQLNSLIRPPILS
jgi:hypothetical protein